MKVCDAHESCMSRMVNWKSFLVVLSIAGGIASYMIYKLDQIDEKVNLLVTENTGKNAPDKKAPNGIALYE